MNQIIKKYMLLSVILSIYTTLAQAGFKDLCGDKGVYSYSEQNVQILVNQSKVNQGDFSNKKLKQCGLPGLDWRVCTSCDTSNNSNLLVGALEMLSAPNHRNWHNKWHTIRAELDSGMNALPVSLDRLIELKNQGWISLKNKSKKSLSHKDFRNFRKNHRSGGSLAGEDFLFMHRQMIKMVQAYLTANGNSCIAPWLDLPSLQDKVWPVPRAVTANISKENVDAEAKDLENIIFLSQNFFDNKYLKSNSLNQLGLDIETHIHGKLHVLYASPKGSCSDPNTDDRTSCDDLDHDRSSHVNKYFWKLHGFIDQLIGNWLKANEYKYIYKDCKKSPNYSACYEWSGTWLGKEPN